MPVTIDKFEYATDAAVQAAWSTVLKETLDFQTRVIADGGTVINLAAVNAAITHAYDNSYYDNIYGLYGSNFAYKMSGSAVIKVYDVSPNNRDLTGSSVTIAADGALNLVLANSSTLTSGTGVNVSSLEYWSISHWSGGIGDGNEHIHIGAVSGASMFGWNSNKPRIGRSAVAWDYEYGSTHYNAYGLYGVRWDGATHYLRINGGAIGSSANDPTVNSGIIRLGASGGGGPTAKVKELLVLDTASADRAAIESFLNSTYSIY